jgi:tyrosine-protein phosphatase SIW14
MRLSFSRNIPVLGLIVVSSPAWAANVAESGLPHFFKVNEHIYRGAQPTTAGWASLAKMGVKVVIDLRRDGEDGEHSVAAEARAVEAAGMRFLHVPMNGIVAPGDGQISQVLDVLNSPDPVFVHCKLGKDRTGTVIACYRISHDGWTNRNAMNEAKSLGLHFVEVGMKRYISSFRPSVTPGSVVTADTTATAAVR